MLLVLGVILVVMGIKGMTQEGIWLTRNKQIEGPLVKVIGILVILGGVSVIAYAVFLSLVR